MYIKTWARWNSAPTTLSTKKIYKKLTIPNPGVDKDVQKVEILDITGGIF